MRRCGDREASLQRRACVDHEPVDAVRRRRARAEVAAVHAVPTSRAARLEARRARARRAIAVSAVSAVVVIGGVSAALVLSPGWHAIRTTFFSWHYFSTALGPLFSAFWLDVR